jgi:hypothetical protein
MGREPPYLGSNPMTILTTLILAGALSQAQAPAPSQPPSQPQGQTQAPPQNQTPPKEFKPSANPVSDAIRDALARGSKKMIAAAELMPAEKYSFHPTPAQMTFGKLIAHVAETNFGICAGISGTAAADVPKPAETAPKEALVAAVKQSFDFCTQALSSLTDAKLGEEVVIGTRHTALSKAAGVIIIAGDWEDHYSTAAAYLRQNDILPPTAQPKK